MTNNRPFTPGWKENKFPRAVCAACRKNLQVGAFYWHEAQARALCKWCANNNPRIPPLPGDPQPPPEAYPRAAEPQPEPPATLALVLLELREQTGLLRQLVELMEHAAGRSDAS